MLDERKVHLYMIMPSFHRSSIHCLCTFALIYAIRLSHANVFTSHSILAVFYHMYIIQEFLFVCCGCHTRLINVMSFCDMVLTQWVKRQLICKGNLIAHIIVACIQIFDF